MQQIEIISQQGMEAHLLPSPKIAATSGSLLIHKILGHKTKQSDYYSDF